MLGVKVSSRGKRQRGRKMKKKEKKNHIRRRSEIGGGVVRCKNCSNIGVQCLTQGTS